MALFIQTTVEGGKELRDLLREKNEAVNDELIDAIETGCIDIENEARRVCPVEFANLKDNITHELEASKDPVIEAELIVLGKVGVRDSVGYAEAVEVMGERGKGVPRMHGAGVKRGPDGKLPPNPTKKMPYLFPSYQKYLDKINKNISEALVRGINK